LIAANRSYRKRCQILTKDEDQIVRTMAFTVLFAGDDLDALAVTDKCIRQTSILAVAGTPISQCLMADLAKDVPATARILVFSRAIEYDFSRPESRRACGARRA
jgi:hypothetical protein